MTALIAAALCGLAVAGLWLAVRGLVGTAGSLDAAVADLHRRRGRTGEEVATPSLSWVAGRSSPSRMADLAVCDRDSARWIRDRLAWMLLAACFAGVASIVIPVVAGSVPAPSFVVGAVLVAAIAGWFYAAVDLHTDAEKARRRVRHAVASYLELVTILMAGGAGPESAMFMAAEVGRGDAFRHLRSALAAAQIRQEPPWALLGELGRRLGVGELIELGASMTLAGGGAQVKDSLATKAGSMRIADLARIEAEAQSRSETMALPVVMMFTGFLLLIGYPALAGLTGP